MAARKSCTHLTWAEAKSKSGISASQRAKQKEAGRIKADTHGKLLAAKILAKAAPTQDEKIENRQAARQARRDQIRQAQLDAEREAQKEEQRQQAVVRPHEQALVKLEALIEEFEVSIRDTKHFSTEFPCDIDINTILESKQLQLDEVVALQAIYGDTPDVLKVSANCAMEDLQNYLDLWQDSPDDASIQQSIRLHPPLRLALKRSITDPNDDDFILHCLVEISMPSAYPIEVTPPDIHIAWFLLTKKSLVVSENKPLESFGSLDEIGLWKAFRDASQELLGMPCLYEMMDTWFTEHIFEYVTLNPILPI